MAETNTRRKKELRWQDEARGNDQTAQLGALQDEPDATDVTSAR
jgi:hypothetical protein